MALIYIDTNTYLDLYRDASLKAFKDIDKYHAKILLTEQTVDEFYRNRGSCLREKINGVNDPMIKFPHVPLIMGFDAAKKLDVLKKEAQALVDQIRAQLTAYLESDADDPICSVFKNIVANVTCHRTADQFIESAKKRKVLGKPPISKEKYSIGDELIWETLVGCVKNDLIIVSRDRTFLNNIPILKEEYRSRTGRELTITDSITDALGKVGEMSEALADAEVAIAERSWHEERIRRSNEIAEYERAARQIDPSIGSFGAAGQYSGHRIRTSLQRYRAAIGNADNLTEDQKRLLTRVDDMIARWEGWPDNNAETLAILKAIKVLAQSLGKT